MFDNYSLLSPAVLSHYCFLTLNLEHAFLEMCDLKTAAWGQIGFGRAHSACCHSICQAIFTEIFPLYRIFKTPGLRTPAARERIYNVSVNGSPLADSKEIFLTVPVGGVEVSVPGKGGSGHGVLLTHHFFLLSITHFSPGTQSPLVAWLVISTLL